MGFSMMHEDVAGEILRRLPVQTLLRLRSVSKFYRDFIDSPSFQELHLVQNANRDNRVILKFTSTPGAQLSIRVPEAKKFNTCMEFSSEAFEFDSNSRVVGPVNGLICIHNNRLRGRCIYICNPSLGKIRTLPLSPAVPLCDCLDDTQRNVGIGFDAVLQDYKVVELLSCRQHRCVRASVYSTRTNSWRHNVMEDKRMFILGPIRCSDQKGYSAHWRAIEIPCRSVLLSFDMRKEVFRVWWTPESPHLPGEVEFFARGNLFVRMSVIRGESSDELFVYKSIKLYKKKRHQVWWGLWKKVEIGRGVIPTPMALSWPSLVGSIDSKLVFYDFFHDRTSKSPACITDQSTILVYECSFVSP